MKNEINAAIVNYLDLISKYNLGYGKDINERKGSLDWKILKACVFLSISENCIQSFATAEEFLEEFERILLFYHVEEEQTNTVKELENGRVKITGYDTFQKGECVSCFFMLSLFVVSHAMDIKTEQERERFLNNMIKFPCFCRIRNCFSEEYDQSVMRESLGLYIMECEKAENLENIRDEIGADAETYDFLLYLDVMEYEKAVTEAVEGKGIWMGRTSMGGQM